MQMIAAAPQEIVQPGLAPTPVLAPTSRHTIHSYYLTNPESPDGRHVLFFSSTDPEGQIGEVRIVERATGKETVLAENVHTEDAHRTACQQWLAEGRLVAFHEVVNGNNWRVVVVDVASGKKTVVAEDRQLGFGSPAGTVLPLYGRHWNPGAHRDLELWDAVSGRIETVLTAVEVAAEYPDWIARTFGNKPVSIFFPVLSPDTHRVIFKMAAGSGGEDFRSPTGSQREGMFCFDLGAKNFVWFTPRWGHPVWHPDSRRVLDAGFIIVDPKSGTSEPVRGIPSPRGTHPAISPDGRWLAADGMMESIGGTPGDWGLVLASLSGAHWRVLHSFSSDGGATSWRPNHPHPVFSADGKRIYFNLPDGPFTRLCVAEITPTITKP